jgi:hypothetical protein
VVERELVDVRVRSPAEDVAVARDKDRADGFPVRQVLPDSVLKRDRVGDG